MQINYASIFLISSHVERYNFRILLVLSELLQIKYSYFEVIEDAKYKNYTSTATHTRVIYIESYSTCYIHSEHITFHII